MAFPIPVLQVHGASFRVSVTHRTLTSPTGSLTCVRDHYYYYTRGLGTPTTIQHNIWLGKQKLSQIVLVLLTGLEPRVFGTRVRPLYQLSHPVIPTMSSSNHKFRITYVLLIWVSMQSWPRLLPSATMIPSSSHFSRKCWWYTSGQSWPISTPPPQWTHSRLHVPIGHYIGVLFVSLLNV